MPVTRHLEYVFRTDFLLLRFNITWIMPRSRSRSGSRSRHRDSTRSGHRRSRSPVKDRSRKSPTRKSPASSRKSPASSRKPPASSLKSTVSSRKSPVPSRASSSTGRSPHRGSGSDPSARSHSSKGHSGQLDKEAIYDIIEDRLDRRFNPLLSSIQALRAEFR